MGFQVAGGYVMVNSCVLGMSGGQQVSPGEKGPESNKRKKMYTCWYHTSWRFKGILAFRHI